MNIEFKNNERNERGFLYSVEFPQASSACQISFWYVFNGGNSPLSVSLLIDDEVEAVIFFLSTNGNYTAWQFTNIETGI